MPADLAQLQRTWTTLYRETLPALAKRRDACQPKWPVFLDHCFARIILDNSIGITKPWAEVISAPAVKHMSAQQLEKAIDLGHAIMRGQESLVHLDQQSLKLRGKAKPPDSNPNKRKPAADDHSPRAKKPKTRKGQMADVWADFRQKSEQAGAEVLPTPPASSSDSPDVANDAQVPDDDDTAEKSALRAMRTRIAQNPSLPPFRKRVLTLLTQVPRGRYTTYGDLAAAAAKSSSASGPGCARAVGSAMRNNPYAPEVPCHRVLAADRRIGGFKGDWGEEGRFVKEKRHLLRSEGVKFDGNGKVVGEPFRAFS